VSKEILTTSKAIRPTRSRVFKIREIGVFGALLLLIIFFSLASEYFFKLENLLNILRQVSLMGIMGVGMTMVITSGEIDLSLGSVYGLSAVTTGVLMTSGVPIWLSVLVGLLIGLVVGTINGLLVTYGKIPALIVTIGMLNVARGLALLVVRGLSLSISERFVEGKALPYFIFLGQGELFGYVPMPAVFLLAIAIIGYLLYNKNIYGFHIRAVGGNPSAARASGIGVNKIKIFSFVILGFLSSLAGILNLSFLSNIQGTSGQGVELSVIAAVIIGGTSLSGGKGTIIGTIIGVLIMGVLKNGLILLKVSPFYQIIMVGLVIIVAVGLDMWTKRDSD
jgi:ribose/xylose/arabinose/galactoside ABC-type transport system permease subunit